MVSLHHLPRLANLENNFLDPFQYTEYSDSTKMREKYN